MRWQLRRSEDHSDSGVMSEEITWALAGRSKRRNSGNPKGC